MIRVAHISAHIIVSYTGNIIWCVSCNILIIYATKRLAFGIFRKVSINQATTKFLRKERINFITGQRSHILSHWNIQRGNFLDALLDNRICFCFIKVIQNKPIDLVSFQVI